MKFQSCSVEETRAVGARFAETAKPGCLYVLEGDLGAGKTELVRGFVGALNPKAQVRSPSFSLCNIYETPRFPVYHFDFYRLTDATELGEIGFDEYASGDGVCLVEWGTMFPAALPQHAQVIKFTDRGMGDRDIEWSDAAGDGIALPGPQARQIGANDAVLKARCGPDN
jgi:tRNA threonylcarbamoyladenosine biosynthesis protein TsaE